jgi:putative oxidoreductase
MAIHNRTAETTRRPIGAEDAALEPVSRHAHWLLRFVLGSVFIYMGLDKFMGGGLGEFAGMMGLPVFLVLLVALSELGGGTLVVIGGFSAGMGWVTRLGALLIVPVMLGAIFMVKWGQWHFMATPTHPMGGMMFEVALLMVALYLLIKGNRA